MLDLVKVKIRLGKLKIPIALGAYLFMIAPLWAISTVLVLTKLNKNLERKGFYLADRSLTSEALTGIELLIEVDYFTRLILRQKRSLGTSLFVTKGGGVIPFGLLPKWAASLSE